MADEQDALGLSDLVFKPLVMRLIEGLRQKSVDGVSRNGGVRVTISGDIAVRKVAVSPELARDVAAVEQQVAEAIEDAFLKTRELVRMEARRVLGNIPWIDDLFNF
jgi:DNA-binding protein YbaB